MPISAPFRLAQQFVWLSIVAKSGEENVKGSLPLRLIHLDPLIVTPLPSGTNFDLLRIENPSRLPLTGRAEWWSVGDCKPSFASKAPLRFSSGERELILKLPTKEHGGIRQSSGNQLSIFDAKGRSVFVGETNWMSPVPPIVSEFTGSKPDGTPMAPNPWPELSAGDLEIIADGDPKIASVQTLNDGQPPVGPSPSGTPSWRIKYQFSEGWKSLRIIPKPPKPDMPDPRKVESDLRAFGIWVHGDGQGGTPCIRLRDATGQVHQVRGAPVSWKGWRYITFSLRPAADSGQTMIPLPGSGAEQRVSRSHWGGANDGVMHTPIEWDSLFLLDGNRRAMEGEIFLSAPTLVY